MDGSAWVSLFRRIPVAQHNSLVLVTSAGMEIMVQRVVRLEKDFVIVQGRFAGSTDAGRVLIIPYDQINNVAINKLLFEREIDAMFGKSAAEVSSQPDASPDLGEFAAEPMPDPMTEEPAPAVDESAPADGDVPAATGQGNKPGKAPPSKSILLARLRARLSGKSPPGP